MRVSIRASALASAFLWIACGSDDRAAPLPGDGNGLAAEAVLENLDTPWDLDFLPDGSILLVERPGVVSVFENGVRQIVGTLPAVSQGEGGALGLTLDPDFQANRVVYIYYTHADGNRVSRFTLDDTLSGEEVLIGDIPSAGIHNGGRIAFGPDSLLYITTGDAANPSSAQDTASLAGKILRIRRDGSIPEDNPFGNAVYSYGHRNPQGLAWHPETGRLYASEHGPDRMDEINLIGKGANYGWPEETCTGVEQFRGPIRCYSEFTLAPTGVAFFQGDLYVAGLRGNQLRRLRLTEDGTGLVSEDALFTDLGRLRIAHAHGGNLYFGTSNRDGRGNPAPDDDRIFRMTPD
jgi:glucose/arabinose dehydrogenase